MAIEILTPTDDDWPAICRADGRAFAHHYSDDDVETLRRIHDLGRFRVAVDDGAIVSVAGSYALDVTLPGGTTMPMGGVTWVSHCRDPSPARSDAGRRRSGARRHRRSRRARRVAVCERGQHLRPPRLRGRDPAAGVVDRRPPGAVAPRVRDTCG